MIVLDVGRENAPKLRFVQDDHMIEALPPDRADHTLDVWILPRARRRGHDFGDAHGRHGALERAAIDAIAIPVHPARYRVVRKGVSFANTQTGRRSGGEVLPETLPFSCPFSAPRSAK